MKFMIGTNHYGQMVARSEDGSVFVRAINNVRNGPAWELELCVDGEWLYQRGTASEVIDLFHALTR